MANLAFDSVLVVEGVKDFCLARGEAVNEAGDEADLGLSPLLEGITIGTSEAVMARRTTPHVLEGGDLLLVIEGRKLSNLPGNVDPPPRAYFVRGIPLVESKNFD